MDWETPVDLLIWSIIFGIAWSLVVAISPWQSSRYLMAKNENVVIRSGCIAAIAVVSIQMMLFLAASTVNLSKTDIMPQEQSMIWASMNILPPLLGALLLAGIMSAALSSASTFLSLVGFSVANDILPATKWFKPAAGDRTMLGFSRFIMLMVGTTTLLISLFIEPNIFWLTYFAGTVFAASWGAVAFMSIWSDRITESAAFWGMISGFVGTVILKLLQTLGWIDLPTYFDPIVLGGALSVIVIFTVSARTKVTEVQRSYRLRRHLMPVEENSARYAQQTRWAAVMLGVFGVTVAVMLANFYVQPYQSITGTLRNGQTIDWTRGEALHAIGWAVLFLSFSVLAYRVIRRTYGVGKQSGVISSGSGKLAGPD